MIGEVTLLGKDVTTLKKGDVVGVSPVRWSCMKCENCLKQRTNLCDDRVYLYGGEHSEATALTFRLITTGLGLCQRT